MKKTTLIVLVLLFSFSGVLFAKQPAPIKVREGLIQWWSPLGFLDFPFSSQSGV